MLTISLGEFLHALGPTGRRVRFCKSCRTSLQYLRHIVAGRKRPSVELCIVIERASKGVVRCESLRPDVDWAYLARRRIRQ